ncbi:DNA-primase RepB domain-containing protein [Microvirga sp. 17 mud 1-3]|uniref:DNA-primase RepB domain-containing protein n=1 Tax=Microvirga sp. 17 mud 1-3 TaxID=2082949 RepID=UPI000D6C5300|nr:DNA-primase RepB domain-containing protein [Microvirga sp. 17 mud 1-3]AWM86099.1 hypothetical protein C4E04_04660 [Microvirga sp. 17 mud 1-3]
MNKAADKSPVYYLLYTQQEVRKAAYALASDFYRVVLIHKDAVGTSGHQPPISRQWSMQEFCHRASVSFLRGRNRQGYHIYFRPNDNRCVLVDDVCEDAVAQMRDDGLHIALAVETSPANFQVWLNLAARKHPANFPEHIHNAAARLLAKRYGGDLGSAKSNQVGRLPEFRNLKEKYHDGNGGYPRAKIFRILSSSANDKLREEAGQLAAAYPPSPPPLGPCVPLCTDYILKVGSHTYSEQQEYVDLYHATASDLCTRFRTLDSFDRSRTDFAVARSLALHGMNADDIFYTLHYGSAKARERGTQYTLRTITKATNL